MGIARRARRVLKRILLGPWDFPQQCTVGLRDPQSQVTVWLCGLGTRRDVTYSHLMACSLLSSSVSDSMAKRTPWWRVAHDSRSDFTSATENSDCWARLDSDSPPASVSVPNSCACTESDITGITVCQSSEAPALGALSAICAAAPAGPGFRCSHNGA